jgi:general secretion pathway protein G
MKRHRTLRRGLTLLELMIVLIILVGLMAIVGPRLLGSQRKADIRTAKVQIGNLSSALKMYVVDMKVYPPTEEGLQVLLTAPEDERLARNWAGPYIDGNKLPLDPWGNEFEYEFGSTEGEGEAAEFPTITSPGPDGQLGTEDDIANQTDEGESEGEETEFSTTDE